VPEADVRYQQRNGFDVDVSGVAVVGRFAPALFALQPQVKRLIHLPLGHTENDPGTNNGLYIQLSDDAR
jgi:hypothetical protein